MSKTMLNIMNKKQSRGMNGQYKKTEAFYNEILRWKNLNANQDDIGCCYIPLEYGEKKPISYKKLKPQGNQGYQYIGMVNWDWREADALCKGTKNRPIPIETCESDFGILISNKMGCLDFDCQKDFNWFMDTFEIDTNDYMIERGKFAKPHCKCKSDCDYGYHLYFKISECMNGKYKSTSCIWDESFENRRNIDYLCESKAGTGHIVRTVNGMDSREWVNDDVGSIDELPGNVLKHFKQFWCSKKEYDSEIKLKDNTQSKLIEMLNQLPPNYLFQSKQFYNVLRCLRANNVDYKDVFKWSCKLKQSNSKDNDEPHKIWLKRQWANMYGERDFKDYKLIRNIVEEENSEGYHIIHNKYLNVNERYFSRKKLNDIKSSNLKKSDKLNMYRAYYNRFFIYIVDENPTVYMISYSENGQTSVKPLSGKAKELRDSYGINVQVQDDDDKGMNSFEWWINLCGGNEFSRIEFKPYGLTCRDENSYDTYNMFQGYNMKYVKDYNNSDNDVLGDRIEKHFKEVLVAGNEKHLKGLKAWFHKVLIKGERAGVGLLFYSKMNGAGKSWIFENMAENVFGSQYISKTANVGQTVGGNFTVGEDKTILMCEELPQYRFDGRGGSNEVDCALKSMITDKYQRCRKLYKDERLIESQLSFIGFTNNLRCMNPEQAQRRMMMFILDCKYAGCVDYWDLFEEAMCYAGWENWIHRYIIDDKSLKKVKVGGNSSFLNEYADTDLRRLTLDRGLNSMVYWVRDYLDEIKSLAEEGQEDVYSHFVGLHRPINDYLNPGDEGYVKGLFSHYKEFCENNSMYRIAKNSKDFVEALKTTFEIVMKDFAVKFEDANRDCVKGNNPFASKNANLNLIKVDGKGKGSDGKKYYKKSYRSYIIFTEELLLKLDLMVSNMITESIDIEEMSQEEFKNGMKLMLDCELNIGEPDEFDKGINGLNW